MKELSIEEKAKAYDRVSKEVEDFFEGRQKMYSNVYQTLEYLFPELKESEDERIKKELIAFLRYYHFGQGDSQPFNEDWISWLEKQGEQKPVFEIKTPEESLGIDSDTYNKIVDDCVYDEQKPVDADLKDVVDKEANAIWKEINTGGSYSIIDSFNQFYGICMQVAEAVVDCKKPTEWIQELESKLSNANPEQLAEWKEKYFKVEPAWSEEDENILNDCIKCVTADSKSSAQNHGIVTWLKSIKDRVQPKQEWNEEDKKFMYDTINNLTELKDRYGEGYGNVGKCINWLKSLGPQNT